MIINFLIIIQVNMRELEMPFDAEEILKKKRAIKKQLLERASNNTSIKVAILGGSTTKEIRNIMELFLLNYGLMPEFYESEYNQYYEDGMFANPELEAFAPDVIYIHTTYRNIQCLPSITDSPEQVTEKLDTEYERFVGLWERISEVYHCNIIQNNFEMPYYRLMGNKEASDYRGTINFVTRLNIRFYDYAEAHKSFYIHDINYESACYGIDKWSAPFYWNMYKYALCVPAIPYTAFGVANIIKALYGKNKKVLCLDLDNTLWGGIIGDDGVDNIEIGQETSLGQAYAEFQEYIRKHKDMGVLLTVNSKNNEDTARAGFDKQESVLKNDDFVAFRANWNPKSENLASMAEELTLLQESFVFVDDNPVEREIVRTRNANVAVPEIDTIERYIIVLDKNAYFEVVNLSEDDLRRGEMYQANAKRERERLSYHSYEDYLMSLEMKGTIRAIEAEHASRIAQLTNKSNQFNLTTRRYSQTEIEEIAQDKMRITLYGRLEDKFGDNGIVSVVIGKKIDKELHIDLWLMSCRVLKRDMEFAMMDELAQACKMQGIHKIVGYYYPTVKNQMVKGFYELQGFTKISEDAEGNTVWEFDLQEQYVKKNKVINVNENSDS